MTNEQYERLLASHEVMIRDNKDHLKKLDNLNLRLKEQIDIDRKRLDLLERPWWRRLFDLKPPHWNN